MREGRGQRGGREGKGGAAVRGGETAEDKEEEPWIES